MANFLYHDVSRVKAKQSQGQKPGLARLKHNLCRGDFNDSTAKPKQGRVSSQ